MLKFTNLPNASGAVPAGGIRVISLARRAFRLAALLVATAAVLPAAAQNTFVRADRGETLIEVDAAKPAGYKIPRTIFGTFLEPIGKSIYGGLWAQVLENPSLEDNLWSAGQVRQMLQREPALVRASSLGLPLPWEPLDEKDGNRYEPRWGDAANSSRSLFLMALPGERQTGIRQMVYLPVHRTRLYTGSLWAKQDALTGGPQRLEVSLRARNHPETVLAKAAVQLKSMPQWSRYEFSLELPDEALKPLDAADFVVAAANGTRALLDQIFLFPSDQVDGMDPEMIAMCRALRTPVLRYGGNFTSGYHWRDGVGPMDHRVSMLNLAWGMPEYNHFGTDELLQFCKRIGAEPQIALNLGSGTPNEAAEWVRYVNERWGSGGRLWELGNELWGNFQIGYPTIDRIAERTRAFSEAVRAADPRARLIATGQDPDHFREWNAKQLALGPEAFQYLSTHFVVGPNVKRPTPDADFTALASFALPVGLERHLREMKEQIDADAQARGRVQIAFTEWLFYHNPERQVPGFGNLGGAICAAGFLNTLMRVADFTPISDMTGLIEFGGVWKKRGRVYGVPAYWAFRMYSNADAAVPVSSRTTGEGYDVHEGIDRIPDIPDVPYLDVVTALNDSRDRLTLFCVNRHPARDIRARIRIAGFLPAARGRVQTLAGTGIYQLNDEANPEAVHPAEATVRVDGADFTYAFPRASVTVMQLEKRDQSQRH